MARRGLDSTLPLTLGRESGTLGGSVDPRRSPALPDPDRRIRWAILASAVAGLAFVLAVPWVGREALAADDFVILRSTGSLEGGLRGLWSRVFFRPIDLAAVRLVDAGTRDAWRTSLLHLPALAAIVLALRAAARRLAGERAPGLAFCAALAWWTLHVSTSVALWQPDTVSQSLSAAAGLWYLVLIDRAVNRKDGSPLRARALGSIAAVQVMGLMSKETFLGWCFGGAALLAASGIRSRRRLRRGAAGRGGAAAPSRTRGLDDHGDREVPGDHGDPGDHGALVDHGVPGVSALSAVSAVSAGGWLLTALLVCGVPAVFLVLRITTGGAGALLANPPEGGRYAWGGAAAVIRNAVISASGMFLAGPSHVFFTGHGPGLGLLPVASILLTAAVCLAGSLAIGRRGAASEARWEPAALALICGAALAPTLMTRSVSELYLMGPAAGVALWFGHSLSRALDDARARDTGLDTPARQGAAAGRGVLVAAILAIGVLGWIGLAGRAAQFSTTWTYSRRLGREIEDLARNASEDARRPSKGVDAASPPAEPAPALIHVEGRCLEGPHYSVYVLPPADAANLAETERWLRKKYPGRAVRLVPGGGGPDGPRIDCAGYPARSGL